LTVSSGTGLDFRLQAALAEGKDISFWHDIPLFPVTEEGESIPFQCNFVCEIPKTTRKKYEVCTKGVGNPIKQDTKNGKLREYSKGDVWFNYGCLPRTWEDTDFVHPDVGFPGDGDPLDACEIGARMFRTGEVRQTKVLGVICMIDEDETDWKLIVIDVEDRWAPELNSVEDVERLVPGTLDQIREWWRTYKVTDGKPLNKFGLDEKFMPKEYAMEVIVECHEAWRNACEKVETKEPMGGKKLSFSKLEDLDMSTDEAAIKTLAGA
jgi:inorganic pyrophosphatase